MENEKRLCTRVEAAFEAYITVDKTITPVKSKDISLKGAFLIDDGSLPVGSACELHLPLAPGMRIVIDGVIVRAKTGGVAMEFQSMDDMSFSMLRRLVQLNSQDPDVIDREMVNLIRAD